MGIRASRSGVLAGLDRMFGERVVDDTVAPANWSLRIGGFGDSGEDRDAKLQLLYRGRRQVSRSRSPRRVVCALASHVSALADRALPGYRARGVLIVGPSDAAVLADPRIHARRTSLQPLLEEAGAVLVDDPGVRIDPVAGEAIVPEPLHDLDVSVADDLDDRFGVGSRGRRGDRVVGAGRYRLAGWVRDAAGGAGPFSAATELASILELFEPVGATLGHELVYAVVGGAEVPVTFVESSRRSETVTEIASLVC